MTIPAATAAMRRTVQVSHVVCARHLLSCLHCSRERNVYACSRRPGERKERIMTKSIRTKHFRTARTHT